MEALTVFLSGPIGQIVALVGAVGLGWWARKHPPAVTPATPAAPAPATPATPTNPATPSAPVSPLPGGPRLADVIPPRQLSLVEQLLADPNLQAMLTLLIERITQQKVVAAHDAIASLAVPVSIPTAAPVVVTGVIR